MRRVFVVTSGDVKRHHKGWSVAKKKHAFVIKIFATKTLPLWWALACRSNTYERMRKIDHINTFYFDIIKVRI
jgi:hypothetical protein